MSPNNYEKRPLNDKKMPNRDEFCSNLISAAEALGIGLDDASIELMWRHFELVVDTNQRFNLTRVTAPADAAVKLYADSLAPVAWIEDAGIRVRSCLDVGTGAGFPAVPIAIARPKWRVTAIDSTGKKADFVAQCAKGLPLSNLTARQERAGEGKPKTRYDLVLFKAVADLPTCLSHAHRLVAPNGHVIVFKGRSLSREELSAGHARAEELRLQTWDAVDYELPLADETIASSLIIYRRMT